VQKLALFTFDIFSIKTKFRPFVQKAKWKKRRRKLETASCWSVEIPWNQWRQQREIPPCFWL
jgi:hypothetical protein